MMRLRFMRVFLVLAVLVPALGIGSVVPGFSGKAQAAARAAAHDGYGRMVFDWTVPTAYDARIEGGELVVTFDRPFEGSLDAVPRTLSAYVADGRLTDGGQTARFRLNGSFGLRHFTIGTSVVVDLTAEPGPGQEPPSPRQPVPTPQPGAASPAQDIPMLGVRTGIHDGFRRVVFDWTGEVPYRVETEEGRARIVFDEAARIDAAAVRRGLPEAYAGLSATTGADSLTLELPLPETVRIRHFRTGTRVVLDLVETAPPTQEVATPTPAAPPTPAPVEAVAQAPLIPTAEDALQPLAAQAEAAARAREDEAQAQAQQAGNFASLSFTWDQPTAAAVFRRAGYLWVVFDRRQQVDESLLRRLGGDIVTHVEQIPHDNATVVRMLTRPGYNPSIRREGFLWILDILPQGYRPATPIPVRPQPDMPLGPRLFLAVSEGGAVLRVPDPEVGDTLTVVPVLPLGYGVLPGHDYPEFELPVTAQGVVIVPRTERIRVRSSRNGVEISAPDGGLNISRDGERLAALARMAERGEEAVFDIQGWALGPRAQYLPNLHRLQDQVAAAPPEERNAPRLDLARFQFSHGRAAETLGILRIIADEDPAREETPEFRALRGAASFMMHRFRDASRDLTHPSLAERDEAALWRAAVLARAGDMARQAPVLMENAGLMRGYPREVKVRFSLIGAAASIAAADDLNATNFLEIAEAENLTRHEMARVTYYRGRINELIGAFEDAIDHWREVERGPDRLYRARAARARVEMMLALERITLDEAIEGLERLRFAWRGDDFEFRLLERLGDMYLARGDYPNGLRTYKSLASGFPNHPRTPRITETMAQAFERLYLDGAADQLPAVQAIALYDEFRELTPAGARGDEMIRRLADRLVSVDLLDRAAALLAHQVRFRLQGEERARVGARLALVRLLNREPQRALDALELTETTGLPEALQTQRRHLRARALADLRRPEEAVALLAQDTSRDGLLLRAEIEWRAQNWTGAAEALGALAVRPRRGETLNPDQARIVLDWATALVLGGHDRLVERVRQTYIAAMEDTPYYDAFNLLTSPGEDGLIDYRRVGETIRQAENFRAFMASYRERLRSERLSAIN